MATLREVRMFSLRMTGPELAAAAGIEKQAYQRMEAGRTLPKRDTIRRLIKYLEKECGTCPCTVEEIIFPEGIWTPESKRIEPVVSAPPIRAKRLREFMRSGRSSINR